MRSTRKPNSNQPPHNEQVEPENIPTPDSAPRSLLAQLNDTASQAAKRKAEANRRDEVTFSNEQEYRRALNGVLATEYGMEVFKRLLKFTRFFETPSPDNVKMVEENGMKRLYLKMIRPYVNPTLRHELENL